MLSLLKLPDKGLIYLNKSKDKENPSISFTGHMTGIKDIRREAELNISVKDCEN